MHITGDKLKKWMLKLAPIVMLCACTSQQNQPLQSSHSSEFPELLKHFKTLSSTDLQGRKTQTIGSVRTQQYLMSALSKANILPFNGSYQHKFSFDKFSETVTGINIIGFIPCSISICEHNIILSAHYDHLGQPTNSRTYYGADDNASGTAALLSIAERLSVEPLHYNVLVLFTDAEEMNLKGAKSFISSNPMTIDNALININMDMLAGAEDTKTLHYISRGIEALLGDKRKELTQLIRQQPIKVEKNFRGEASGSRLSKRMWIEASDHGAFNRKNIPFIYFGVGIHKNYHTVNDTYENANKIMLIGATKTVYDVIKFMDNEIIRTNR